MHRQGALLSTLPFPGGRRERAPTLLPTTLPQLFAPITSTKPEAVGQGAQWDSSGSELWAAPTRPPPTLPQPNRPFPVGLPPREWHRKDWDYSL